MRNMPEHNPLYRGASRSIPKRKRQSVGQLQFIEQLTERRRQPEVKARWIQLTVIPVRYNGRGHRYTEH